MSKKPTLPEQLAKVVKGVVLPSEADHPFEVVRWPAADLPRDAHAFRKLVGLDAKAPVKSFDGPALLDRLGRESPRDGADVRAMKARYRKLAAFLAEHVTDLHGFKAGSVDVQTYLLGRTSDGDVLGLKAAGVET